ncbi:MAG: hypothetical protein N2Z79_04455, partial [Candidatus Omnitrophica bacterium]|nr:hypothetical protein [Candidatus Omnitrophota bacterium]
RYLKEVVDPVLMSPSSEKCKDCAFFLRFKATLKERKLLLKENLFSENCCQAGCVDFRKLCRVNNK